MVSFTASTAASTAVTATAAATEKQAASRTLNREAIWTFLPRRYANHWSLETFKDYHRFAQVFNRQVYNQGDQAAAEKAEQELKQKYGANYDVVYKTIEGSVKYLFFRYFFSDRRIPLLDLLPSFDWRQWDVNAWKSYLSHLKNDGEYLRTANGISCSSRVLHDFFASIQQWDGCSASTEKLTKEPEAVEAIIASLQEKDSKANSSNLVNKTEATKAVVTAKNPAATQVTTLQPTYDYNPGNWNLADLVEFGLYTKKEQNHQNLRRKEFFDDIICAISDGEELPYSQSEVQGHQLCQRRLEIRQENTLFLRQQFFRIITNGNYDQIPTDEAKWKEFPLAITRTKSDKVESLIFKTSSTKVYTLDFDLRLPSTFKQNKWTMCINSSNSFYYFDSKNTYCIDFSYLGAFPDFVTPLNGFCTQVTEWKKRRFDVMEDTLPVTVLRWIIVNYLYPETLDET